MASRISWVLSAMVVLWLLFSPTASEAGYRGPFKGRVVDAETLQPIQGAVVFAQWNLGHVTAAGRVDTFYDADEVLTDEQGYFDIKKKWSWNPWTNLQTEATVLIYKAGYGAPENLAWQYLRERSASQKARSPEERKQMGPHFYFDIAFEEGLPVFLLKKLTSREERIRNIEFYIIGPDVPQQKQKLLQEEENKERKALGLD